MRILYGVPGEGMGHATRAKVILSHLVKKHDVRIVSSDRAYVFLNKNFSGLVHEIKGFHLAFKKGEVSISKTAGLTLKNAPKNVVSNFKKYKEIHDQFAPDVVISDFESFTYFFAKYKKLPIISIDNMQIMDRGILDITIPKKEKANFKIAKGIVKAKLPKCDQYLVSTFFDVELKKKNTQLIPPVIREEIVQASPSVKNHILVYQSSQVEKEIVPILQKLPHETFFVYGFNKEEKYGNVQLKKFSEMEFIEHFASAKAVIANGGYSFISEAVYLKKPVCSVPIKNQFEQYVNGAYIDKMNYGKMIDEFSVDGIKSFLYDLPSFQKHIEKYAQKGNINLYDTLNNVLEEVS